MKYARWITDYSTLPDVGCSPNPLTFRKQFETGPHILKATLEITAMGIYTVLLNGNRVENNYFPPYFTAYHKTLQVQTYDLTNQLKELNNFEITVGAGWACGRYGKKLKPRLFENRPSLLMELDIEYEDGTRMFVPSDTSWLVSDQGHYRFADWYDGELYDATVDYNKIEWNPAQLARLRCRPTFCEQYGEYVTVREELKPIRHFTTSSGELIYDFGRIISGVISATLTGTNGQTVTFKHAEALFENELFTLPLRTAKQKATYICKEGKQFYSPVLTCMGFRYVGISGIDEDKLDISALVLCSDCAVQGSFICSNEDLNRLNACITHTLESNMVDIPTETCARDGRLGAPAMMTLNLPTAAFLFDTKNFTVKWLKDLYALQGFFGGIPDSVPSSECNRKLSPLVGDSQVLVPWAQYKANGDIKLLELAYPHIRQYLKNVSFRSGLLSFGLSRYIRRPSVSCSDWGAPDENIRGWNKRGSMIATAYYAATCSVAAQIADLLGKSSDAASYRKCFDRICRAYSGRFTNGKGLLKKECQIGYALPLYFGMVTGTEAKSMAQNLFNLVQENNYLPSVGPAGFAPLLFALTDNGYAEDAYRLLTQSEYPSPLYELKNGATNFWESFRTVTPDNSYDLYPGKRPPACTRDVKRIANLGLANCDLAFSHPGLCSVGEFLYRRIAGLEPLEGGYKRILVKPSPIGLKNAQASIRTPYGKVTVEWKTEHAFFLLHIELPEGVSAKIVLPEGTEEEACAGIHDYQVQIPWKKARITENEDKTIVHDIREKLSRNGGYCPCCDEHTEKNKCICNEFKAQTEDPSFEGYCRCRLYKKTYENYTGGKNG